MHGVFSTERINVAALLLKALAVLAPFVAINDYLHGHLITAIGALIVFISTPLLLYVSRTQKYQALPILALICLLLMLFMTYILFEPISSEKNVWVSLYAVFFYFLAGKRVGTLLSAVAMLLLAVHFLSPFMQLHQSGYEYKMGETMGAFLLAAAISFANEHIRSRHESELKKLATQAEAASRAKSEFLSNMSHEIRTPMNSVLGMAFLALKSVEDPKQRDYLEKIRLSGEQMLSIIDDILDFSKIEAGKMCLDLEDFNLESLLNNLGSLLDWRTSAKGLGLRLEIDPNIPPCLNGDPSHLNQVLLNLMNNAIKFTERGEVVVRARLLDSLDNIQRIRIEVQDTGIGINEEQQASLFQPFYQVDSAATRKIGGTGLGLAISKRLVELMGGTIGVESKLGQGSTFWLIIPMRISEVSSADRVNLTCDVAMQDRVAAIRGARILIVENNEINQQVAREILERAGANVCIAGNGQQALDILNKESFDCVLMDVQMPVMDGLEATRLIRANQKLAGTTIIALTASASREDREQCMAAGMDDFISKPIRQDILYSVLARHLAGKPLTGNAFAANINAALPEENDLSDPTAIFDWVRMTKLFGDEKEKLEQFLQSVLDSMQTSLRELDNALQKNDTQALLVLVHDMKAATSLVYANRFLELCIRLEDVAKKKMDASQEREIVGQLNAVLTHMQQAVLNQDR